MDTSDVEGIDFVVLWVDGNDEEWRKQRDFYLKVEKPDAYCGGEQRFRDWGLFRYWFRGVEKYAPWVRKIHLVTCGHLPAWINLNHPKLHIVKHADIIPAEFLPTFSSHTIELNIHKILCLSEQFVYFNDDIFVVNIIKQELFFRKGLPCCTAGLSLNLDADDDFVCILYHTTKQLNKNFNSREVLKKHWQKFINPCYGFRKNLKTVLLLPWCKYWFPGFAYEHGPNAFLKSTLETVWEKEEKTLRKTCSHRFREYCDVNQYIFKWWQCCEGNFIPTDEKKLYKKVSVDSPVSDICKMIENPICPVLVINDAPISDFEKKRLIIQSAFESRFPEKSSFEK